MFPYVLCSCGRDIGCLHRLFSEMRKDKLKEKYGSVIDASMLQATSDLEIELGQILDDIGVTTICCRTKLLTQKLFVDVY